MNLKKIKDNNRKVRDGKLKNLAMAGLMGLASITGMNSCKVDDPLDDEDSKPNKELTDPNFGPEENPAKNKVKDPVINSDSIVGGGQENKQEKDPEDTPESTTKGTTKIEQAPKYLEKGEYNDYGIIPRGIIDIKIECPTEKKALDFMANLPLLGVNIIPENSTGTTVCLKQDGNTENNWNGIIKLMK